MRSASLAALSLVVAALAPTAEAQDNFWTGGASFWDIGTNWSLGNPLSGQRLFIGYSPNTFSGGTTYRSGTTSVASLFSKNALTISGGTLNLTSTTESSTLDSTLSISGGTLGGAANVAVGGLTTLTGGTLAGSGTLTANGGIAISSGTVHIADSRILENKGTLTWSGGTVNADSGAAVTNAAGSQFLANASANWTGGSIANAGSLLHSTSNTTTFRNVTMTNTGTVEASAGALVFRSTNSFAGGTVKASGTGRVTLDGGSYDPSFTHLLTEGNGLIQLSNATVSSPWGAWTIPSTVAPGSIQLLNSTLNSTIVNGSSRLSFLGNNTLNNVSGDSGFKFSSGIDTIQGTFTPGGTVALSGDARLRFTGDRTIDYAIDVQEAGTNPSSGIEAAAGSNILLSSTSSFTGFGGKINADGASFNFRNDGTMSATAVLAIDVAGGSLTNTGTIIGYAQDSHYYGGSSLNVGTGSFKNSGTIRGDNGAVDIIASNGATFENTGTIEAINGGSVGVLKSGDAQNVSWTNAGLLRADGAGSRIYLGGTFSLADLGNFSVTNGASALIYGGTFKNSGKTLTIASPNDWMLSEKGKISGGSIVGSFNLGFDNLYTDNNYLENVSLDGGLNVVDGKVTLLGTTKLNGPTSVINGRLNFTNDVTIDHDLTMSGALGMTKEGGTLTVAAGSKIEGAYGINSSYPQVSNVNLVNNGTLRGTNSSGITGSVTNHGLLEQTAGTLVFYNQTGFTNDGMVSASGGKMYIGGSGKIFNTGTMTATNGGTLWFDSYNSGQALNNTGSIVASGIGSSIQFDMDKPFTLASLGNVSATNGAYLSVYGGGKMDLAGQTLVLGPSGSGSWSISGGGTIFGGAIQNSELLQLTSNLNRQTLRDVTVDHGLNVNGGWMSFQGAFKSGGAINATGAANLEFAFLNRPIDYAVRFGSAAGDQGTVKLGSTGAFTTIASNGEISGRNISIETDPNTPTILNQGLLAAKGAGTVEINGILNNQGTVRATNGGKFLVGYYGTLANISGNTLNGGTYRSEANSRIQVRGLDVQENAANIELDGDGSRLEDSNGNDALRNLSVNSGRLSVSGGRNLTVGQSLQNKGMLAIGPSSLITVTGNYGSTAASNLALGLGANGIGRLAVNGNVSLAGGLGVSLFGNFVPVVGSQYTFLTYSGTLNGNFAPLNDSHWSVVYGVGQVSLLAMAPVPEPASLLALGAGIVVFARRRRKA